MSSRVEKKNLLGIKNKITLAFILFLVLPILIILISSWSTLNGLGNQVSVISGTALENEEYRSIDETTLTKTSFIDEFFSKKANDINTLKNFAEDLFKGVIDANYIDSYYHNDTPIGLDYVYSNIYDRIVSFDASMYFLPNDVSLTSESVHNRDISAHLDVMFRQLEENDPDYAWRYMGFEEQGMFRCFPFNEWTNPSYDPRARPWYLATVAANETIFTEPYIDAQGLGLMITVASPVHYINGTRIGVIAADITIGTLNTAVLDTEILETGYAFLIDIDGNTVSHPNLIGDDINTPINDATLEGSGFSYLLSTIQSNNQGSGTFSKGGETWYANFQTVDTTGYKFVVVVPENEIIGPALSIQDRIQQMVTRQVLILILILGIAVVIIGITSNLVSKQIVNPITSLTKMMNFISKGSFSREIPVEARSSQDEISMLTASFQNLVTMLRLGNTDYYRGDLELAAKNYSKAMEIFRIAENKKGVGICANNLGNIHRIRGDYSSAEEAYQLAIKIALETQADEYLPKRYNNIAQLYADSENFQLATEYFKRAINAAEKSKDDSALALIYRNFGLLKHIIGDTENGLEMIKNAMEIDTKSKNALGTAYSEFYLGKIFFAQEDSRAEEYLKSALEKAVKVDDKRLLLNIYSQLEQLYDNQRNRALTHEMRAQWNKLRMSLVQKKLVIFVIDVSGSMEGTRIKAARKGALEIYENQINPQDEVAIIVFDSRIEILMPPTRKGGNEEYIYKIISGIHNTPYQTAFYDALGHALKFVNDRMTDEHKWIIAFTDGLDNDSQNYNIDDRKYQGALKFLNSDKRMGLNEYINQNLIAMKLILIGIGDELLPNERKFKALCETNEQGRYIPLYDTGSAREAIKKAFLKVSELMAQINVEEFIEE